VRVVLAEEGLEALPGPVEADGERAGGDPEGSSRVVAAEALPGHQEEHLAIAGAEPGQGGPGGDRVGGGVGRVGRRGGAAGAAGEPVEQPQPAAFGAATVGELAGGHPVQPGEGLDGRLVHAPPQDLEGGQGGVAGVVVVGSPPAVGQHGRVVGVEEGDERPVAVEGGAVGRADQGGHHLLSVRHEPFLTALHRAVACTVVAPPTRIVLVRHGESQVTVDQVVGGHTACSGLSPRGRVQAEALRARLERTGLLRGVDALYASVLSRAVETAEVIAPGVGTGSLDVVQRCALCELHVGEGDGLPWSQFTSTYGWPAWDTDPTLPLSPGSESWASFIDRAGSGLQAVADDHPGQQVVVVCHGGVIEASFVAFGLAPAGPGWRLRPENTGLTIWSRADAGWRLDRFNDCGHLDGVDL